MFRTVGRVLGRNPLETVMVVGGLIVVVCAVSPKARKLVGKAIDKVGSLISDDDEDEDEDEDG